MPPPFNWDGSGSDWSLVGSWSTLVSATSPDPSAIPGAADVANLSINSLNSAQIVNLNASQAAQGLVFLGTNTTTTTLLGGGTEDEDLTRGGSGISVNSSAGAVTLGSATSGQRVAITRPRWMYLPCLAAATTTWPPASPTPSSSAPTSASGPNSTDTPSILASDATLDAVSVPYPASVASTQGPKAPRFFKLQITKN